MKVSSRAAKVVERKKKRRVCGCPENEVHDLEKQTAYLELGLQVRPFPLIYVGILSEDPFPFYAIQ